MPHVPVACPSITKLANAPLTALNGASDSAGYLANALSRRGFWYAIRGSFGGRRSHDGDFAAVGAVCDDRGCVRIRRWGYAPTRRSARPRQEAALSPLTLER